MTTQQTAEIVPFPFRGRKSWLHEVATTFAIRRGANQKRAYIDKVLAYHVEHMQSLGIAQERIDAEVKYLERLFFGNANDGSADNMKVTA